MIKHKTMIIFNHVNKTFDVNPNQSIRNIFNRTEDSILAKEKVLSDISFHIKKGELVGFYGANGSGKTTILKLMAGIFKPNSGQVIVKSSVAAVLELGIGLHPDLTGQENIELYGSIIGLSASQRLKVRSKIINFSGLKEKIYTQVRKYSSGMKSRLAFSIVAFSNANILLLDEVFAVGDKEFLDKSKLIIDQLKRKKTIIISSHNLQLLQTFCDRIIKINQGAIDKTGQAYEALLHIPIGTVFMLNVSSNSMYPIIKRGDKVEITRIDINHVKVGDIVAVYFKNIQEIIIHRVMARDKKQLFLRGDNNYAPDQWLVGDYNLIGKVNV